MNRIITLLAAIILFLATASPHANDTYINAAETLAFGVFTSKGVKKLSRGGTSNAPPADDVTKYYFQDFTNDIPMTLGTEFGIEYQINTKPKGRKMDITTVILFPEPGLIQPKGRTYLKSKETKRVKIGQPQLHGYGFDEPWELVPGEWVFEVWHKKAKLVSKTFTIYDPETSKEANTEAKLSD